MSLLASERPKAPDRGICPTTGYMFGPGTVISSTTNPALPPSSKLLRKLGFLFQQDNNSYNEDKDACDSENGASSSIAQL